MRSPNLLLVGKDLRLKDVGMVFERAGYEVRVVGGNGRALYQVMRGWPDLVIVAERAWESGGIDLAGYLRTWRGTPLIILGESPHSVDCVPYLEQGASIYMTAPVDMRELLARAKNLLRVVWSRQ